MARAAAVYCLATVLLLAVAIFASGTSEQLTAVQGAGVEETGDLLPVHNDGSKEDEEATDAAVGVASLASSEERGKTKVGSDWGKAKKLDDDDDNDDSKDGSDSDSDSDHDDDSDSGSDSNSDSDSDSDNDSDSDSDSDSDDDDDDDGDHHNSKHGQKKKHAAHGRKGAPGAGGKNGEEVPKVLIKV